MTKAEMAAEIKKLSGEDVNPDSFKAPDLEAKLSAARASAAPEESVAPKSVDGETVQAAETNNGRAPARNAPNVQTAPGAPANATPNKSAEATPDAPEELAQQRAEEEHGGGAVWVVLGPRSPAGRLRAGTRTIVRVPRGGSAEASAVQVSRREFDAWKAQYDLIEVEK